MIEGISVQALADKFLKERAFKSPQSDHIRWLQEFYPSVLDECLAKDFVVWRSSCDKIKVISNVINNLIPNMYKGMVKASLLKETTISERFLRTKQVDKWKGWGIWGRIDFLTRQISKNLICYDGKAGSKTSKFLDKRQLIMYALMVKEIFRSFPLVAYIFYQDGSVKPVKYTEKDIISLNNEIVETVTGIESGVFKYRTNEFFCSKCAFNSLCPSFERLTNLRSENEKRFLQTKEPIEEVNL